MTTSMHIRGGLILWREVLESSSRREGPPRPTRGYSLSRRFGTREIATWTEGVILRGGGRPLKQAREASDTGAIQRDLLRPFSSTAIPASLQGFLLQVLRPAWGRRACSIISFLVKETVLRPPSVSVLRSTFFFEGSRKGIYCVLPALPGELKSDHTSWALRKLITPSWISRYPVGKSRTPMSEYR